MPEVSIITAYPTFKGHPLEPLFQAISDGLRAKLIEAYDARLRNNLNDSFQGLLQKLDSLFAASRYPFEPHSKAKQYDSVEPILKTAAFLREFVHALPPKETISWRNEDDGEY